MMFFKFISNKAVDACAKELAVYFARSCPLMNASANSRSFEKQIDHALAELFNRAKTFRQEHRLGIFKRARLAKKFQDELILLGYEPELVNRVTTALVATALAAK